jgi:hypothetical protein
LSRQVSDSGLEIVDLLSHVGNLNREVVASDFKVTVGSLERVELDSERIELSSEVVNSSRKLGILVRQVLDLDGHVVDGGLGIGKGSLKR